MFDKELEKKMKEWYSQQRGNNMKICWDNLEKLRYNSKTGKWYIKSQTYVYMDSCEECGEPYLTRPDSISDFCGHSCSKKGKRSYLYGKKGNDHPNYKHGMFGTPTYHTWFNMKRRCLKSNHPSFKYYGGRGITVCERWMEFNNFLDDMGERPEGKTLDRIENNGNYELSNCKWSTSKEQHDNSRLAHDTNGRFISYDICPICKGRDVEPVEMFDYIKLCRPCNKQFVGHIHN